MGSGGSKITQEEATEKAAELGLVAFFPKDDELFIDDDHHTHTMQDPVYKILKNNGIEIKSSLYTVSKSGNRHVYIKLSEAVDNRLRLFLQAVLGSDVARETLGMLRYRTEGDFLITLYEKPDQAAKVNKWREL